MQAWHTIVVGNNLKLLNWEDGGVIGADVGRGGGSEGGQVVPQWPADWHHLYCPNNRSIWLSSQASIYPNCIKSNRKNETLIKANQYPAPQLWPEDLGMAGAAVICTLLTPMSATFVSSYTKKNKFLVLNVVLHFCQASKDVFVWQLKMRKH